jgi:hypothetical protein
LKILTLSENYSLFYENIILEILVKASAGKNIFVQMETKLAKVKV